MNMPLSLDNTKDRQLIDWLKTKTNRSAVIREVLYSYLNNTMPVAPFTNYDEEDGDDDFIESLNNFKGD